jgi:sec-independent protein translocase protein TatB
MHLGDSIFIFILALVLFGPKKLPEMAKQIGKLMAEFRRASNDFRMQIDEELRTMERQEQQKKQEAERAAAAAPSILPPAAAGQLPAGNSLVSAPAPTTSEEAGRLQILPPTLGEQVSAGSPYAVSAPAAKIAEVAEPDHAAMDDSTPPHSGGPSAEDHPLLRVDSIPVDPEAVSDQPTGLAAAQANAARLLTSEGRIEEPEQASLHHG